MESISIKNDLPTRMLHSVSAHEKGKKVIRISHSKIAKFLTFHMIDMMANITPGNDRGRGGVALGVDQLLHVGYRPLLYDVNICLGISRNISSIS